MRTYTLNSFKIKWSSLVILGLCIAFVQCTGEECSATATILNDRDSDCVPDDEDNCIDTYNPNQEDSDEDDVGDDCQDTLEESQS